MDNRTVSGQLKRSPLVQLLGVCIVVTAWAALLYSQVEALSAYSWQISPLAMAVAILCGALYFVGLAFCWALLLNCLSGLGLPLLAGARVWLISMLTRYIPGNIWHILSRVALANELQATRAQVFASATIEQLLTLIGALGLFGLCLPFWAVGEQTYTWMLALVPLGLLALHPRLLGASLGWLAVKLRRPELAWPYRYKQIVGLALLYSLVHFLASLGLLALLAALTPLEQGAIPIIIGGVPLAWAVGYLSLLTPSGLGVREGVLALVLAAVVPLPVAIIGSLLFRIALTLGEFLVAAMAWGYRRSLVVAQAAHKHP